MVPLRNATRPTLPLLKKDIGFNSPSLSAMSPPSLMSKQTQKQLLPAITAARKSRDVNKTNQFIDNYFLRPSRPSRYIEQTLKLTQEGKFKRKRHSNVQRSTQLHRRSPHSISISQQLAEDSLFDAAMLNRIVPQKLGQVERYRTIDLNQNSADLLTPLEHDISLNVPFNLKNEKEVFDAGFLN